MPGAAYTAHALAGCTRTLHISQQCHMPLASAAARKPLHGLRTATPCLYAAPWAAGPVWSYTNGLHAPPLQVFLHDYYIVVPEAVSVLEEREQLLGNLRVLEQELADKQQQLARMEILASQVQGDARRLAALRTVRAAVRWSECDVAGCVQQAVLHTLLVLYVLCCWIEQTNMMCCVIHSCGSCYCCLETSTRHCCLTQAARMHIIIIINHINNIIIMGKQPQGAMVGMPLMTLRALPLRRLYRRCGSR